MTSTVTQKLERTSRIMQWACLAALAIVLFATAFAAISLLEEPARIAEYFANTPLDPGRIGRSAIVIVLLLGAMGVFLVSRGLYALWQLFGAFTGGEVLSAHTAGLMRMAGWSFLAAALWGIFANTLSILVLTAANPEGQQQLVIGVGSAQLFPMLLAGVLFAIGHVLVIATELEHENRQFV